MDRMKLQTAKDRFDRLAKEFETTSFDEVTLEQLHEMRAAIGDVESALDGDNGAGES